MSDQQKKSLAEVMAEYASEPGATKAQPAQPQPDSNLPAQPPTTEMPSKLPPGYEQLQDFKDLSPEAQQHLRENGDPFMASFDNAIAQTRAELAKVVNDDLATKNQETIDPKKFGEAAVSEIVGKSTEDAEDDDMRKSFQRQFEMVTGEEDATDSDEESSDDLETRLRELNEQIENGSLIDFDEPNDRQSKSKALDIRVRLNTDYIETVKSVLTDNDIKFKTKKKGGLKKGLLKSFLQRKPHVTAPLVNSGIYVTLSGATIPEVIQMNSIQTKSGSEAEMIKLGFIKKHLVETSVGNVMSTSQFAKLIYWKDFQTLLYTLFVGTFPEETELPVICEGDKCGHSLKLVIQPPDLVLNASDFEDETKQIMYTNTTISQVLEQSALAPETQLRMPDTHAIIGFHIPSVWDAIYMRGQLEQAQRKTDLAAYSHVVGYLMYIKYIALVDEDGEYVKFSDIEELLEILNGMDNSSFELIENQINEYVDKDVVRYGFKAYTCPKCGKRHKEREVDMSDFLFTLCQVAWAKMQIDKRKKKNALWPNVTE